MSSEITVWSTDWFNTALRTHPDDIVTSRGNIDFDISSLLRQSTWTSILFVAVDSNFQPWLLQPDRYIRNVVWSKSLDFISDHIFQAKSGFPKFIILLRNPRHPYIDFGTWNHWYASICQSWLIGGGAGDIPIKVKSVICAFKYCYSIQTVLKYCSIFWSLFVVCF